MLLCALVCLASGAVADAITADNPFQSIVDRNVFGLKAPPPPPAPPEPPKPPLPPIALTGIMTGIGKKRALLEGVMPAKPPEPSKKSFYTLAEGEQQDEVRVLKIDEKAGSVEINLMGTVTNLTFAAKMPPSAPQPGAPPGQPIPGIPSPVNTGVNPAMAPGGFNRSLPGRPLRVNPDGGVAPTSGLPGAASYGQPQASAQTQAQPQFSRDESALIIEAERQRLKEAGDPLANLMPVTHLTSEAQGAAAGSDGTQVPVPATPIYRRTRPQ